jgi:hypothetical protein
MRTDFDPRRHLRQLDDGREHLDLKWRLVWLRHEHPDAQIETQVVPGQEAEVFCRATITLRTGGSASGHGSAVREESDAPIEEAENRALARALTALGYGAEFDDEDYVELHPSPSPPVSLMTARTLIDQQDRPREPESTDEPEPEPQPEQPQERPPDRQPGRSIREDGDEARTGTDISWTKFWEWARARGYRNANELSELLGVDVLAHTPAEVRRMLKRYELENPPGGPTE